MKSIKPTGLEFPQKPESIVELNVDENGLRVRDQANAVRKEFFLRGTEPKFAPKAEPTLDNLWENIDSDSDDESENGSQSDTEPQPVLDDDKSQGDEEESESDSPSPLKLFDKADNSEDKPADKSGNKSKPSGNKERTLFEEDLFE